MDLKSLILIVSVAAAVSMCGCVQAVDEESAFEHFAKGQVHAYQGDLDKALEELTQAIQINPDLSVIHTAIGDIHRRQKNYVLAVRSYKSASGVNPYAFLPHYNLGVTYQLLSKAETVAEEIQAYLRLAANVYIRAVTLRPDDFETNLNLSVCYFQLGKNDLAEQYCRRAIDINPESTHAYSNLGIIFDRQGRLYDAVRAYKASLERDSQQASILINLGATYAKQKRFDAAQEAFELAAQVDPSKSSPWERMGGLYYRQGKFDNALTAYEKAVELDSSSASAHRGIGVIHMTRFVKDSSNTQLRDKALASWNWSLEINPAQPELDRLIKKYTPQYTGPQL